MFFKNTVGRGLNPLKSKGAFFALVQRMLFVIWWTLGAAAGHVGTALGPVTATDAKKCSRPCYGSGSHQELLWAQQWQVLVVSLSSEQLLDPSATRLQGS